MPLPEKLSNTARSERQLLAFSRHYFSLVYFSTCLLLMGKRTRKTALNMRQSSSLSSDVILHASLLWLYEAEHPACLVFCWGLVYMCVHALYMYYTYVQKRFTRARNWPGRSLSQSAQMDPALVASLTARLRAPSCQSDRKLPNARALQLRRARTSWLSTVTASLSPFPSSDSCTVVIREMR